MGAQGLHLPWSGEVGLTQGGISTPSPGDHTLGSWRGLTPSVCLFPRGPHLPNEQRTLQCRARGWAGLACEGPRVSGRAFLPVRRAWAAKEAQGTGGVITQSPPLRRPDLPPAWSSWVVGAAAWTPGGAGGGGKQGRHGSPGYLRVTGTATRPRWLNRSPPHSPPTPVCSHRVLWLWQSPRGGLPSRCLHCPPPPPPASCPTQAASGRLSHLGLGTSSGWRTPPAPRLRAMGLLQPSQLGLQPLPNPPAPGGPGSSSSQSRDSGPGRRAGSRAPGGRAGGLGRGHCALGGGGGRRDTGRRAGRSGRYSPAADGARRAAGSTREGPAEASLRGERLTHTLSRGHQPERARHRPPAPQ